MTTTVKVDWDARTIELVIDALKREARSGARVRLTPDTARLSEAIDDISNYRAMVEAVKADTAGDEQLSRDITDATTYRMAAAALRRRWEGQDWRARVAELLDSMADDLHPLP
jgi:hypothetical protein